MRLALCSQERNVIPGVTLDQGLVPLCGANEGEMTSQGLDLLDQRCEQYYKDGLRFAKWRALFTIKAEASVKIGLGKNTSLSNHHSLIRFHQPWPSRTTPI